MALSAVVPRDALVLVTFVFEKAGSPTFPILERVSLITEKLVEAEGSKELVEMEPADGSLSLLLGDSELPSNLSGICMVNADRWPSAALSVSDGGKGTAVDKPTKEPMRIRMRMMI